MPDLPTISVTAAQATKLLNLFGSVDEYKRWLKEAVRVEAIRRHTVVEQEAANEAVRASVMAFEQEIPAPDGPTQA